MTSSDLSRRGFLGAAALGAAAHPAYSQVRATGADLKDLTIKEVKVYVIDPGSERGVTNNGYRQIASIVTNSGIEGNYTLGDRYWHPNWSNLGWLPYAKAALKGKNALDIGALTSQWMPEKRRLGQLSYAAAIDNCLWDILGKAAGMPVYRMLGAYRDKVLAYGSSPHLKTVEEFVDDARKAKAQGFKGYKIHPPGGGPEGHSHKLDMEVIKAVRQEVGDDFALLHDPVGVYTREEAIVVGRLLDKLGYVAYEDPIPTKDIDGLVELTAALDVPIHVGEFITSPYDYAEYIRRRAFDVARFIVDNVGGITGGMKIAHLAESFGMECAPHNWGEAFDHAVHFHCELAMPNNVWFEMTLPQGIGDRSYIKDRFRINRDGYVEAPTKPGLGYEIDRDALDKIIKRIDT